VVDIRSLWDIILVMGLVIAIAPWFGNYLGRVYMNRPLFGDFIIAPIENGIYRLLGTSPRRSMGVREYMLALVLVNGAMFAWMFFFFYFQASLPFDGRGAPDMSWSLAFHSSMSFTTNTNFTHFVNESQVSLGAAVLAWQLALFLSAATGLAVAAAMIRGFVRKDGTIGNFYVDMVRGLTRILFPIATLSAVVMILLGVPQTLTDTIVVHPILGGTQTIFLGPVASFQSMSLLGTNGGGWYSANAASPFANPSAISNLFETGVMMLIPFSTPFAFGQIIRRRNESWPYLGTILIIFVVALALFVIFQSATNPALASVPNLGAQTSGYTVGQETRFSLPEASFFQVVSVYSNVGANNMALSGISPGAQLVLLFGMFTQSTPGGEGTGFGTLLLFAVLAIFLAGLMVGRSPEYLGKKIGTDQVKWAALALLVHPAVILVPFVVAILGNFTGFAAAPTHLSAYNFTVVLYEFTSEAANNGSAMSPPTYTDSTLFFNVAGALVMMIGRFLPIFAMLQVGGLFARQGTLPPGPGTLRTASATFTIYLTLILIIISALFFLPVIAIGPLAQMVGGL
jgi:potassium-transporting ATPase potassium-binding subunit